MTTDNGRRSRRNLHLAYRDLVPSPLNEGYEVSDGVTIRPVMKSRVCIYAAGMGRDQAPLEDDSWEVWALNLVPPIDGQGRLRASIWWDIHQAKSQTSDDMRWIAKCPVPIVVPPCLMNASKMAVALPVEKILQKFPNAPFSSTFCWQMAMALMMGYETIGLFGAELAYGDARERTVEWAGLSYWIGYAEARGVEIARPRRSRLGRHPRLYGLQYDEEIRSTKQYLRLIGESTESHEGIGG